MIIETPVVFFSEGAPLVGRFLRNTASLEERRPAVVVTGSWLTVKEQMPLLYGRRLAELGYTAFIFDFTGFGQSGGDLRQAEIPSRKIADIAAAHEFLRTFSFVDPEAVSHLAICATAQYALRALGDGRLPSCRAFASVAGWFHDAGLVAPFYGGEEGVRLRMGRAEAALSRFTDTGEVVVVPAYDNGNDRAGMSGEVPYYGRADRGAVPEWRNEMAELSWLYWLTYDGVSPAGRVTTPTLMVHGDACVLPDNARRIYDRLAGPKHLLWSPDGGQIDWYDQPPLVDRAIAAVDDWFSATLRSGPANVRKTTA